MDFTDRTYLYISPGLVSAACPECPNPGEIAAAYDDAILGSSNRIDVAMLIAQCGHESAGFTRGRENMNYSTEALISNFGRHRISVSEAQRYGRNADHPADRQAIANTIYGGAWGWEHLGNTEHGDGWRFRGGGDIQLTGRYNWGRYGFNPGEADDPWHRAQVAVRFYIENVPPGAGLEAATNAINGGLNGIADRGARLDRARRFMT